jgi:hypothetical protein
MKRLVLILSLVGLFTAPTIAQQSTTRFFFAYTYENLTIDNTAGGIPFTSSKVTSTTGSANAVTFSIECSGGGTTCPFRMTIDGTTPTTSVGMRLDYGSIVTIYNRTSIIAFRGIREGATSAILNVTYLQ